VATQQALSLKNITVTKPNRRMIEEGETPKVVEELIGLTGELGWLIVGEFGSGKERQELDFRVYKPDNGDFTDEEIDDFKERLDVLIMNSLGFISQGELQLVSMEISRE